MTRNKLATTVAVIAILSASGQSALAATCKPAVTGTGSAWNNTALANVRAKDNWAAVASTTYGYNYKWVLSHNASVNCSSTGRLGNRTWTCLAKADPCKLL